MNKEELEKVEQLIEQKDSEQLKDLLAGLHPADIAELCNELDAEEARFIYLLLDNETAADVLIEMDEDARKEFWKSFPLKQSPNGSLTTWIRMMPWTLSVKWTRTNKKKSSHTLKT